VSSIILILVALGGIWGLSRSHMETDMRALGRKKLAANQIMDRIVERFNLYPAALQIICHQPDSLAGLVAGLQKDPLVRDVASALDVLPPDHDIPLVAQAQHTLQLQAANVHPDPAALQRELRRFRLNLQESAQMAFLAGNFGLQQYLLQEAADSSRLARIEHLLAGGAIPAPQVSRFELIVGGQLKTRLDRLCAQPAFGLRDLPALLRERYYPIDDSSGSSLVYVSLHRDIWKREVFELVQRHLSPSFQGLTGSALLSHMIVDMVLYRGAIALVVALVACYLVLVLYLRSARRSLFGMLPILAAIASSGYVFYIGRLLGVPLLNYISVSALVLITGIGMEYSVRSLAADAAGRAVVAKSIFASGIFELLGFGGIVFCSHAGLRGFGLVLCLGLAICLIFSLIVNATKKEGD
jgi:hypothetical protein